MTTTTFETLMAALYAQADPEHVAGMARFGVNTEHALGINLYTLRDMVKGVRDHALALRLWETGILEARLLAVFVDDPAAVTPEQMDCWAADFNSWDICDQACTSLFDQTPHAWTKALEWAAREEEFVRRGAFALIAGLAWHDKTAPETDFLQFLPLIRAYAGDGRNYVKKAVSWALRNIGKRRAGLYPVCLELARELSESSDKSTRWVGKDAYKELLTRAPKTE